MRFKKTTGVILAMAMCLSMLFTGRISASASAVPTGNWNDAGNYSATQPATNGMTITISSAADLAWLSVQSANGAAFSGYTITLSQDIDLSAHYWTPLKEFDGTFDGSGKTIENLAVKGTESFGGLSAGAFIAQSNGASFKNIKLANVSVNSVDDGYFGALVGGVNNGTITGCSASGNVSDSCRNNDFVGGLVGFASSAKFQSCSSAVNVSGNLAGGLVGQNAGGHISDCFASGNISCPYATSMAPCFLGGLVATGGWVENCHATGNVTSVHTGTFGGLSGGGTDISDSYATGNVTAPGSSKAGGLIGTDSYGIKNSFATGNVICKDTSYAGGLAGYWDTMAGDIKNCYATGSVTCGSYSSAGGFVGSVAGINLTNCYSVGNVTANGQLSCTGGFIGTNSTGNPCTITNCYWNSDAAQSNNGTAQAKVGVGNGSGATTAKSSAELKFSSFLDLLNANVSEFNAKVYTQSDMLATWKSVSGQNGGYPMLNGVGTAADPVPVTLRGITVTAYPTKLSYNVGEKLDLTGLVVTGTYSDGTTAPVKVTAANVTGFDSSRPNAKETLTVSYSGKSAKFTVVINAAGKTPPVVTGIKNNAFYSSGKTITFNKGTATLDGKAFKSGGNVTSEGKHTLIVTDSMGLFTTITFFIDKTVPKITAKRAGSSVIVTVTDANLFSKSATRNGKFLIWPSGGKFTGNGIYVITATDAAGNKSTYKFTI